ncbi:MAG: hypothetical protein ABSD73_00560 [Candidatus Bathyarchaeia archaeon]|jgi:hypothetical protein
MKISLYDMFGTNTLRDRETALLVTKRISDVPSGQTVQIDFSNIIFASRSFCHELLTFLRSRNDVQIENTNKEVQLMMIAAVKKPENVQEYPMKKMVVC